MSKPVFVQFVQEDIPIHPKEPNYEYNMGEIAYNRGDYEIALAHYIASAEAYEQVNRFSCDHAIALINVGLACHTLERYEEMFPYCDQAEAIVKSNINSDCHDNHEVIIGIVRYCRGGALFGLGEYENALPALLDALEIFEAHEIVSSHNAALCYAIAYVLCLQEDYEEAFDYLTDAFYYAWVVFGNDHPETKRYQDELKILYEALGYDDFDGWLAWLADE